MATSTNFGWTEPDDTDLVKNGASAMRTLGNAIDSSLYTLSGGIAGKNRIINGGFDIWQRGTSVTVSGSAAYTYTADRWWIFRTGFATGCSVSRQATGDTTNLPNIQYAGRFQRTSGNTSTGIMYFGQDFESVNSIPFAGKTVTFSFWARAGANFSSASNALNFGVSTGTGTDQELLNAYTGQVNIIASTATLTTTWQRFTATAALSASTTQIGIGFNYTPTGTAGANDYFEITGVQLELGSSATPFSRAGGTIQGELAACQRYYWRNSGASANNVILPICGSSGSSTTPAFVFQPPVTMRVAPTSIDFANLQAADQAAGYALSSLAINANSQPNLISITASATGLTAYRPLYINASTSNAYIGFSAEL